MKKLLLGCALAAAIPAMLPAAALAQPQAAAPAMNGVRLDVVATGRVARAPDQVTLSAGVTTRAAQAEAALAENAQRMTRVRAALERAGIAARDIQTGHVSLSQDYRPDPANNGDMRPSGYVASNNVNIRFRDIARAGRIIDALVAEGANNVNGPSFGIADREPAMDEARTRAIAAARARAELYARALGTRVLRIVAISEVAGGGGVMMQSANFARAEAADTRIEPGEVEIEANVMVTFELERPGS